MFEELRTSAFVRAVSRGLLAFDAWINSSLFESGQLTRRAYDDFATYMERFHVAGGKRLLVEFACEGLTLGLGGFLLIRKETQDALQAIFANSMSIEAGLNQAVERGNAILRRFEKTYAGKQLP